MALARTVRSCAPEPWGVNTTVSPLVVMPSIRRQARRKFSASAVRWKPRKSAPSRPSTRARRQGSWANSSTGGKGMWLNQPIRTSGRSSRTIAGTSCSW